MREAVQLADASNAGGARGVLRAHMAVVDSLMVREESIVSDTSTAIGVDTTRMQRRDTLRALQRDLQESESQLRDAHTYRATGRRTITTSLVSHSHQRSVGVYTRSLPPNLNAAPPAGAEPAARVRALRPRSGRVAMGAVPPGGQAQEGGAAARNGQLDERTGSDGG